MKITVTEKHLNQAIEDLKLVKDGVLNYCKICIVAQAIVEQTKNDKFHVNCSVIWMEGNLDFRFPMTNDILNKIIYPFDSERYDDVRKSLPYSFEFPYTKE